MSWRWPSRLVPRIRTLKPEHKTHRKVGPLTDRQYRLWIGMITEADDEGRLIAEPLQLRAMIFAYHPAVTARHVIDDLAFLSDRGLIRLYSIGDTGYADFPSWRDHQVIDRRQVSKLPPYQDSTTTREDSTIDRRSIEADQGSRIKDQGRDQGSRIKERLPAPSPDGFGAFWLDYPRKEDRQEAQKAYSKAVKTVAPEVLLKGLALHLPELLRRERKFVPLAATWLNKRRWEDEVAPLPPGPRNVNDLWAGKTHVGDVKL